MIHLGPLRYLSLNIQRSTSLKAETVRNGDLAKFEDQGTTKQGQSSRGNPKGKKKSERGGDSDLGSLSKDGIEGIGFIQSWHIVWFCKPPSQGEGFYHFASHTRRRSSSQQGQGSGSCDLTNG
ncbi:hypothetical protein PVK06_039154 [Gossypium arboreum]|uniref:Uncharacterized protein n=1 Tax=Gossypium arboreum TaxID=29729 RepID=A0ABR0N251_GOSAR|nr:hypothetical protein PVK06_039154 [Gossypium arboreum]